MQLVLRGEDLFESLDSSQQDELWRPEFASYMLEGTPGQPYGSTLRAQGQNLTFGCNKALIVTHPPSPTWRLFENHSGTTWKVLEDYLETTWEPPLVPNIMPASAPK